MFTGGAALPTLVHILRAVNAFEANGTGTHVCAVDGRSVANGARMTGIGGTGVVQMTEESRLSRRTLTVERADAVVTRGAVETRGGRAVVDIVGTRDSCPAVDANAGKGSQGVDTRRSVLTHVWSNGALVDIARAIGACPLRRTLTRVSVDGVQTRGAVLTEVSAAVVDIVLTVLSGESDWTLT
jgi:hypothetical protein